MLIFRRLKDANLIQNSESVCYWGMVRLRKGIASMTLRDQVIPRRDVVFDDTSTPGVQKDTPVKYVQLQVNDEPTVESLELQKSVPGRESEVVAELDSSTKETLPTATDKMSPWRSKRSKHKPDQYGEVVTVALSDQDLEDPVPVTQGRAAVDRDEWNMTMEAEM